MVHARTRTTGVGIASVIAIVALVAPSIALAATVTVSAIPGKGWAQAPETTADVAIAESPTAGLGSDSLQLTIGGASDKVGVARPFTGALSEFTGGSWMT